jgi:acetyltransferase-like isoleucine patch superfamily enzyme
VKFSKIARRFLIPSTLVSITYAVKYKCMVSPRAEVDLSALLTIGKGCRIGSFTKIKATNGPLTLAPNVFVGSNVFISSDKGGVTIGEYTMVSSNSAIIGNNYSYDRLDIPTCLQETTSKGINIEDNVWIGAGCVILDGTVIGSGSIISPNSVVTKNIPPNSVVQGNPGQVIFTRR